LATHLAESFVDSFNATAAVRTRSTEIVGGYLISTGY
jgi:hypothetical protein